MDQAMIEDRTGPPARVEGQNVWVARCREKAIHIPVERAYEARKIGMVALQCESCDLVLKIEDGDQIDKTVTVYLGVVEVKYGKESALMWHLPGETEWRR